MKIDPPFQIVREEPRYSAVLETPRGETINRRDFDDYAEACEWISIRQETCGDPRRTQAKVLRSTAVIWSHPKMVETGAAKRAFDSSLSQQCVAIVH